MVMSLAAFEFCLHLACIGRPRSLELQVEDSKNHYMRLNNLTVASLSNNLTVASLSKAKLNISLVKIRMYDQTIIK